MTPAKKAVAKSSKAKAKPTKAASEAKTQKTAKPSKDTSKSAKMVKGSDSSTKNRKAVIKPVNKHQAKKEVITQFAKHPKDTGSAQVQVAILTKRINELTVHLQEHKKDDHSRRGLLLMVGKRRKLLNYLKNSKPEAYEGVLKDLDLRK